MTHATYYHCIYMTIWRLNERHYLRIPGSPANDSDTSHLPDPGAA